MKQFLFLGILIGISLSTLAQLPGKLSDEDLKMIAKLQGGTGQDANGRPGIAALKVAGPSRQYGLRFRPELRVRRIRDPLTGGIQETRITERWVSIRDHNLRYQTTNQVLFTKRHLHSFLPSSNVILYATNRLGRPTAGITLPHWSFINIQMVTNAGFKNEFRVELFSKATKINFVDDRVINIIRNLRATGIFGGPRMIDPRRDPMSHPERIIFKYNRERLIKNRYFIDMEMHLHPPKNFHVFKGKTAVRAFELRPKEKPNTDRDWLRTSVPIHRFSLVDLIHKTPKKTLHFKGCQVGRKFLIDGKIYQLEAIQKDQIVIGMDPLYTPAKDPGRFRKYKLTIPKKAVK